MQIRTAVVSGVFASGGSVLGKLAGFYEMADLWNGSIKLGLLLLMIASNTVGCTLFVKALAGSGSSLPITVTSSSVNYICSAAIGLLVFGESTSPLWWCGTSLVLLGLLLICRSPATTKEEKLLAERKRQ